ncbi:hypothetical protein [Limibacterium fermenti]|uniref:hypothetical protein n=1 Tax=Limibacterium fermenti TaxID=3229863 RepID=UPI003A76DD9D
MTDRISQFIKYINISVRAFEQSIGASDGMIRRAINNHTDIQSKWITAIAENYPQIDLVWLITGKGEMINLDERSSHPAKNDKMLLDKIIELTKENTLLHQEINKLQEQKKYPIANYPTTYVAEQELKKKK